MSQQLYPLPAHLNLNDKAAATAAFSNLPAAALLLVLFGYALGSFFGGMVAARFALSKRVAHAVAVGLLLMVAGIANLLAYPHPLWFVVVSLLLYLPMAYFGGMMSARRIP
jgi:hypothetical protein